MPMFASGVTVISRRRDLELSDLNLLPRWENYRTNLQIPTRNSVKDGQSKNKGRIIVTAIPRKGAPCKVFSAV